MMHRGKGNGKGKTNADMKTMGRNMAKIANQKRGLSWLHLANR
jgi:hypothetical protein